MVRLLLCLALALVPAAANAGTRATFVERIGYRQIILIADNGDLDIELRGHGHLLVIGGHSFIVQDRLTGPLVMPLDELVTATAEVAAIPPPPPSPEAEAAMSEAVAAMNRAAAAAMEAAGEAGEPAQAATPAPPAPPTPTAPIRREGIVVNGRTGIGYYSPANQYHREQVIAVISDDPALAPIGAALRLGMEAEERLFRAESEGPPIPGAAVAPQRAIFASGTPIQIDESKLRNVERIALPSIQLPAEPETGPALRARLADEAAARYTPRPPEWDASRALFAGGRLYLVAGDHRLLSLAEGEQRFTQHDAGEPVLDACVQGGDPVALTGAAERAPAWTLRRLQGGQWRSERTVTREGDEPVALTCPPQGVFLLTGTRFIDLTRPQPSILRLRGEPLRALVTAAVHVTPEAVFVGLNAGEFGGGLHRIDRRSGRIRTVERNADHSLCGGPLNTACDPIQAIATVPWRPNCIVAAIGLMHMMSSGKLTMVCLDRVELLYATTDEEPEDPEMARRTAQGGLGSIAFFGVAARGNGLIAIGHNGLYRLSADGAVTHSPLPRFTRVEGALVSFALPDVVLVVTGINGRAAVGGAVPIMAVR